MRSKLDNLEAFKEYIDLTFKPYCRKEYGLHCYTQHIQPCLEDFMENIEAHVELLAEETVHEEELTYDNFTGE
jgi:hypothetical protein